VSGAADGDPLLLGSSLGTIRAIWDLQMGALGAHFGVLRYDHLGHGQSPVPAGPYQLERLGEAVLGLAGHLGLPQFDYAGLSLGGMVGMWLAGHAPARVVSLTLLCTSAHMPPAQAWLDRAATVRSEGMASVVDAVSARWFTPRFATDHPRIADGAREALTSVQPEGCAPCCEAIADMDLRADLAQITAPTLVIAGDQDLAAPAQAHAQVITTAVPGARLALGSGAHLASVESPQQVAGLVLAYPAVAGGIRT
jgi:3-oxoadipate enol-lactonase